MTTSPATVTRLRAPSGNPDHDYWQAQHVACGWVDAARYPNRTIEGRALAERNAEQHRCVPS